MKPFRLPGDPAARIQEFTADEVVPLLDGRDRSASFTLGMPDTKWTPDRAPHIGIFDDSGPVRWPIYTAPLIRVTAWSDGRGRARHIAALTMGALLSRVVPGIASIREPSSILDARDPTNAGFTASFTIRTTVRTTAL